MLPKYLFVFALVFTTLIVGGFAQTGAAQDSQSAKSSEADAVTVPSGTKVMLALIHPISTKSARPGDGVYLRSTFPVVMNDEIVIPPGTYVQGEITEVER